MIATFFDYRNVHLVLGVAWYDLNSVRYTLFLFNDAVLITNGANSKFMFNYWFTVSFIRSEMWKKVDSVTSDGLTSADEDDRPRRRRLRRFGNDGCWRWWCCCS